MVPLHGLTRFNTKRLRLVRRSCLRYVRRDIYPIVSPLPGTRFKKELRVLKLQSPETVDGVRLAMSYGVDDLEQSCVPHRSPGAWSL